MTIARGDESVTYPARGLVVFAANPCPCGDYHPSAGANRCTCPPTHVRAYQRRVRGPITDRIDITRHLQPLRPHEERDRWSPPEPSAAIRARVADARSRQAERYADRGWRLNGQAPGPVLQKEWPLSPEAQRVIDERMYQGQLSRRGATRVHRISWTVADLRGAEHPLATDTETALRLRTGEPLLSSSLPRAAS